MVVMVMVIVMVMVVVIRIGMVWEMAPNVNAVMETEIVTDVMVP